MSQPERQLISYIAPGAPATRRPASDDEPFLRPEIGFTPLWYRTALGIDFSERWHTDPAYRRETVVAMRENLARRFPGTRIGGIDCPGPLDLLTGTFGACNVAAIYGIPILYAADNWPNCEHSVSRRRCAGRARAAGSRPQRFFPGSHTSGGMGRPPRASCGGVPQRQGVLNNAYRLRGEQLFCDMLETPDRARHLFECVTETMLESARSARRSVS